MEEAGWRLGLIFTCMVLRFPLTGTSQGGILGTVLSQNVTEGDNGVLVCPVVDGMVREYQWKLNGVLSTNFNDVIADGHILKFRSISLKYDDTAIQCMVTFTSGEIEYSNNATLRVFGRVINTIGIGANVTDFPPMKEGTNATVSPANLQPPSISTESSSKLWIVAVVLVVLTLLIILPIWAVLQWLSKKTGIRRLPMLAEILRRLPMPAEILRRLPMPAEILRRLPMPAEILGRPTILAETLLMSQNHTQRITIAISADLPVTDRQNVDEGQLIPPVQQETTGPRRRQQPFSALRSDEEANVADDQARGHMEEAAIEPFVDADAPNCDDHNAIQHGDEEDEGIFNEYLNKVNPPIAMVRDCGDLSALVYTRVSGAVTTEEPRVVV